MADSRHDADVEGRLERFYSPYRSAMDRSLWGCCGLLALGVVAGPLLFYIVGDRSIITSLLAGLGSALGIMLVIGMVTMWYQSAIAAKAARRFNEAFAPTTREREIAIAILSERAARAEDDTSDPSSAAKSLLDKLGEARTESTTDDAPVDSKLAAVLGDSEQFTPIAIEDDPIAEPDAKNRANPAPSAPPPIEPMAGADADDGRGRARWPNYIPLEVEPDEPDGEGR